MSITPPPEIDSLPQYPTRGQKREDFTPLANQFVAAQQVLVTQMNAGLEWTRLAFVAIESQAETATDAASTAVEAKNQGVVARDKSQEWATKTGGTVDGEEYAAKEYASGTVVPSGSAKQWANAPQGVEITPGNYSGLHFSKVAEGYKDTAQVAAAAAQSAAGLPSLAGNAGKALMPTDDEQGVKWGRVSVGPEVGHVVFGGWNDVRPGYLRLDDSQVLSSAYPDFSALVFNKKLYEFYSFAAEVKNTGTAEQIRSFAYGNGVYVAGYNGGVVTSTDGDNWTVTAIPNVNFEHTVFGNGVFVSGGYNSNTATHELRTSTDGVNWTLQYSPSEFYFALKFINGSFFYVGQKILKSNDGASWSIVADVSTITGNADSIAKSITFGNNYYIAAGSYFAGSNVNYLIAIYSSDGENWSNASILPSNPNVSGSNFFSTDFGSAGVFVQSGTGNNYRTQDGLTWDNYNYNAPLGLGSHNFLLEGNYYLIGSSVVYASYDFDAWASMGDIIPISPQKSAALDNSSFVCYGTNGGLAFVTLDSSVIRLPKTISEPFTGYVKGQK